MATQTMAANTKQDSVGQKLEIVRQAYADAPEYARVAVNNLMGEIEAAIRSQTKAQSAGRVGLRQGKVSELTGILTFAPGGAKRLRTLLSVLGNNFQGADLVGTLHDMRFVFLENDTKLLFATAYDGDWDTYIDDFVTKIPNGMDALFSNLEGWPGIRSPKVKDFLVKHQLTADAWYVANPNLTVSETRRLGRVGKALDEFLDKVQ